MVNLFIVYEIDIWSRDLNAKFKLGDCMFGALKLIRNADPDKYWCSGYGIGFDARADFSINGE